VITNLEVELINLILMTSELDVTRFNSSAGFLCEWFRGTAELKKPSVSQEHFT
jgi:hypothetical protein